MNDISVIMVSYYTGPALWLAIDSVLEQPECRELILVDNGNIPGVKARLEVLAGREPRVKLISGQGNVGFARACNLGVRASGGDIILLLNPDSMLPEGGLARATETLQRFPENTLAGCLLINPDGSEQRGSRRALLNPHNAFVESLGLKRFFKGNELNFHGTPVPERAVEVPAISGAFMMLSRAFYDRLGGLDEGYFLHMEDMDLCARVHDNGGKVICMPEVKVIHFRSTSESPSMVVERHKTLGFIRYFEKRFSGQYSSLQLSLMRLAIWGRYMLKVLINFGDRAFTSPLTGKYEVARLVLLYRLTRFSVRDRSLADKTIVVTGATGQTGLCAVGQALARGARVIAIHHNISVAFSHPNLTWLHMNLVKQEFNLSADVLFHTAGLWLLPKLLPSAAASGMHRVIAVGSTSMFSKTASKNKFERETVERLENAEIQSAQIARANNIRLTILRPTLIYGVALDTNLTRIADIIRRFGIIPVYGAASGRRHPVQAMDVAKAALDIIDIPATFDKSYNTGGGHVITYRTMIDMLFQYMGKKPRIVHPPMMPGMLDFMGKVYQLGYLNGEMARRMNWDMVFDIQEAVNDFGYRPKAYLEGDVEI